MPFVAFLHAHVLAVVLFLFLFAAKAALLLLDKRAALHKVRRKTKALDMLFGTLILLTGGYLLFLYNGVRPRNVMPVHGTWRMLRANAAGYSQLYWYRGGLASWQEAGLPMAPLPEPFNITGQATE